MARSWRGALVLAWMVVAGGCSKPCEEWDSPQGSWAEHPELVPGGGTVCTAGPTNATIDFEEVDDPMGHTVDHLEAQGWERSSAVGDRTNFRQGEARLDVSRVEGHPRVALYLMQ